ncbi:MAG: hypothetical protein AB7O46_11910 [Xanthobacteraceae bacterium]
MAEALKWIQNLTAQAAKGSMRVDRKEFETMVCQASRMTDQIKGNLIGLLFVAAVAAIGIYIVLAGLGMFGRGSKDAPGWVLVAAGGAFLFAAASMGSNAIGGLFFGAKARPDGSLSEDAPYPLRAIQLLLSLGVVAMLATVGTWVAFNPDGGSASRNTAFMAGAIITWVIFFGLAFLGLRRLRR